MAIKCPKCDSPTFFYVQRSYEFHHMDTMPDADTAWCDLGGLSDSEVDDTFEPYLHCHGCNRMFSADGTAKVLSEKE